MNVSIGSELRSAYRSLLRAPWFTAAVVVVLALGIGGSTAVFSVVDQVLLKPLPYDDAGQLVRIYQADREQPGNLTYVTGPAFEAYRSALASVSEAAATYTYSETGADLSLGEGAVRVRTLRVSSAYFDVLRTELLMGRAFTRGEERADAALAVISHDLWQDHLSGQSSVLGTTLDLSGVPYTVIGVAPVGLEDPVAGSVDVWVPLERPLGDPQGSNHPENHHLTVLARLERGVGVESATAELSVVDAQMWAAYPEAADKISRVIGLHEDTVAGSARMLYVLLGAVGLVLLIGCVNVANLLLARATVREREFAVRAALGSGRGRLVMQLMMESALLAAIGCAAGIALGAFLLDGIVAVGGSSVPRLADAVFDLRVLVFGAAVSVLSAVLFGLLPALRHSRAAASGVLRENSRSITSDRRRNRVRSLLVGTQIALAFMLVAGAAILTLSMHRLRSLDLGFEETGVATFEVHLPAVRYDVARRAAFHEEFSDRLRALPGVLAAGAVSRLPATGSYHSWGSRVRTGPLAGTERAQLASEQRVVAGDYFEVMQLDPLAGRLFEARDDASVPRRVVISRSVAERAFPGTDAVGHTLAILGRDVTVIGVVDDVALTVDGGVSGTVYHAHRQFADNRNWALTQVVRASGDPSALLPSITAELKAMDPQLVLHRPAPLDDVLGRGVAQRRFTVWLMTGYAALALVLASLGLFGVVTYVVRQRRREIGIRTALGARPAQIRRMVLEQGVRLTAAGIAGGVLGAAVLGRVLEALLFETRPAEPLVLLGAAAVMTAVSLAAVWLPAREATSIDPGIVLQQE